MPMKLLSPVAQKDARQTEITRQLLRAKETEDIILKINVRRAKAEADFADSLARNRVIWAQEEEEHAKRLKDMEAELKPLEERKRQALIPLEVYKEDAAKVVAEARRIFDRATEKEQLLDQGAEMLEQKLTAVADRENAVTREEKRQEVAKLGIETQQEETKKGLSKLSEAMFNFDLYKQKEEGSLLIRKKEVSLAEINFKAKTEKYQRDLEALKILEAQLKDERATLDRAIARQKK